jgi:outer membrane protein OmpA-like peptidoglycan-associated protein
MNAQFQTQAKTAPQASFTRVQTGLLQRQCSCGQHTSGGECEECRKKHEGTLQRAAVNSTPGNGVPPIVHEVLSSPGQPLDAEIQAFMEPRFGYDFSGVRVHTDTRAAESARSVNALAYTVGRDVVFGAGQYMPKTMTGKRLMAHELTHVVQQHGIGIGAEGAVQRKLEVSQPGDASEQEAEVQARSVVESYVMDGTRMQEQPGFARLQRQADISQAPSGLPCILVEGPGHLSGVDIFFGQSSPAINEPYKSAIANFANDWVSRGSKEDSSVDGYASVDGPNSFNWQLSCDRAEAVKAELVSRGIPANKITTFAHGETKEFSSTNYGPNRHAIISTISAPSPTPVPPAPVPVPPAPSPSPAPSASTLPTEDCNANDISEISRAHPIAIDMVKKAIRVLSTAPTPAVTALLQKYFNDSGVSTQLHVLEGLQSLRSGITGTFTIECEKKGSFLYDHYCKGVYAYVYTAFSDVHLCEDAFGRSDVDLAETIVHESSHKFDNTDDEAYCWGGCPSTLDRWAAYDNADSFSKFAWEVYTTLP